MTKWRSVSALLILGSAIACATPTNGGDTPGEVDSGGSDSSGGPPLVDASGSSAGGAASAGAPSAGSASVGTVADAGAAEGGASAGTTAAGGSAGTGGVQASAGGASGALSGGASGTSSSGGAPLGGAGAGSDGPCANPMDVTGGKSNNLGTKGAVCMRTAETFNTIGCSNFGGRTIKVNGVLATCAAKTTFPPAIGGYNYFDVSAGDVDFASFVWYTS